MRDEILAHVGRCIYCGTTAGSLSNEHVIPYALNGPWVLEEASCQKCADLTSSVEMYVLRTHLLRARVGLGLRTRHPRERPDRFPVELFSKNAQSTRQLRASEQPVFMLLPLYDWPVCVETDQPRPGLDVGGIKLVGGDLIQVSGKPMPEFNEWMRAEQITSANIRDRFDPVKFARLIAKIAYGFAVARVGLNQIDECHVLPTILGATQEIGRWVGCDLDQPPTPEDASHRVTVRVVDGNIMAHVKLFAHVGTQEYLVAVGTQRKNQTGYP